LNNYPSNIEEKLGFDQVRERVKKRCQGIRGQVMAENARFSDKLDKVQLWLGQTREWMLILENGEAFPEGHYLDISSWLRKLKTEGYFLFENEFHEIRLVLRTIEGVTRFFSTRQESYPLLFSLLSGIKSQKQLIQSIEKVIDESGKMRFDASPELAEINRRISGIERELHKKALQLFKNAKSEGWTPDLDLSIREGRLVLPVIAEHKRKVRGIVHDESASGQILYIEPAEIIELNNELRELQLERRREAERILRALTVWLAPYAPDLEQYNTKLGVLDFVRAKALFAREWNAVIPGIQEKGAVKWINAFHPLLLLHHKSSGLPTVPLGIELGGEERMLVISGPNAGGKSVALKCTGLLQYMTQCGFPVTAGAESSTRLFRQIFIDIGDDQSLDNDLSTYSSHLRNMKHFTLHAGSGTLVLIDEFGTGTDPQFGGPMAEAILEELNKKKCYGVVTTHYSNLKLLAGRTSGLFNGAMAYDTARLMPLYRLETGKPGSSFAFEVASKIGLHRSIIEKARKKVGSKQQNMDDLLLTLEKEKAEMEEEKIKAAASLAHFERLKNDYMQLKSSLEERKADILHKAREEAAILVKNSNRLIEHTVREIKESTSKKHNATLRKELEQHREQLEKELSRHREQADGKLSSAPLETGCYVRIKGQSGVGQLMELGKSRALVQFGEIRSSVETKRLERVEKKELKKYEKSLRGYDMYREMTDFRLELDVRGKRAGEALQEVITYLDKGIMLGFQKFTILHGKGDGILRKLIRQELKKFKEVEKTEDGHIDAGGDGVTVVYLK
jgi:DNA mismatch repair protein MutS2